NMPPFYPSNPPTNTQPPTFEIHILLPTPRPPTLPPIPTWSHEKDLSLRSALSQRRAGEIDWPALAHQLGVPREYLLQQAAWVYERDLSSVRAQIAGGGGGGGGGSGITSTGNAASGGFSSGAVPMSRGPSARSLAGAGAGAGAGGG